MLELSPAIPAAQNALEALGWVDITDPEVGYTLDELQRSKYFVGVRHIWESEEDPGWITNSGAIIGLKELARRDLPFDFLAKPPNLPYIPQVMDQVPDLRAVVDHIAKPLIADHLVEPWLTDLLYDNVHTAFMEDLDIVGAQQENIRTRPDAPRIDISHDSGGLQARRVIEALIADEQAGAGLALAGE